MCLSVDKILPVARAPVAFRKTRFALFLTGCPVFLCKLSVCCWVAVKKPALLFFSRGKDLTYRLQVYTYT